MIRQLIMIDPSPHYLNEREDIDERPGIYRNELKGRNQMTRFLPFSCAFIDQLIAWH